MYGDPHQPRDVLEYVVMEKHIANEYGQWRVHGKIIPDWMPARDVMRKTYVKAKLDPLPEIETETKPPTNDSEDSMDKKEQDSMDKKELALA